MIWLLYSVALAASVKDMKSWYPEPESNIIEATRFNLDNLIDDVKE